MPLTFQEKIFIANFSSEDNLRVEADIMHADGAHCESVPDNEADVAYGAAVAR
jgi:hypothetical protein